MKLLIKKILYMQIPNYLILNVFYEKNYLYKIEKKIKTQFIEIPLNKFNIICFIYNYSNFL